MGQPSKDQLRRFSLPTRTWFTEAYSSPTAAQAGAWPSISSGDHTAVIAPTGSGKTLAAFLWAIDALLAEPVPPAPEHRCRVLYISPLKALAADVHTNLRAPLAGITRVAQRAATPVRDIVVGMRTGDTPAADRRRFATKPPDVLITTPESLYLMLTSSAREGLHGVDQVIVDEVHVLAGSKRGAHLALSLERLDALLDRPAQRIGLSATIHPPDTVANYLSGGRGTDAGGRATQVVSARDESEVPNVLGQVPDLIPAPKVSIEVVVPVPDLTDIAASATESGPGPPPEGGASSIWSHVTDSLVDLITTHSATIVFTNSRRACERLAARINENHAARQGWPEPDPAASDAAQAPGQSGTAAARPAGFEPADVIASPHHGSMSRDERSAIETALKNGTLPAVIATSSLELGIDMGTVDLVVQVGAPPSVAATLQRIGRASHQVGGTSRGVVLPTHRGDLLSAAVTCARAGLGQIESTRILTNPLDVLAQQIVAMCAVEDWAVADLATLLRRAAPFTSLTEPLLHSVLDMLTGNYPSEEFAQVRPLLTWDRNAGTVSARRGARLRATLSGGTIPDRGLYGVHIAGATSSTRGGTRVGELDEEMVYESRAGDTFTLGSSTWRIEEITNDRVLVSPAPGLPGRLPFWKGDTPGRPAELGQAIGAALRQVRDQNFNDESVNGWGLDEWARDNLLAYLQDQHRATGALPADDTIVVERFRDELGDWRVVLHSPFGAKVHAPWALLVGARLQQRYGIDVSAMHADDGIVLRLPDIGGEMAEASGADGPMHQLAGEQISIEDLIPSPDDLKGQVVQQLHGSAHFAARFREAAARSLLLPRNRAGKRQPLWQQRQRSAQLLSVAADHPQFPVTLEAVRECLQDDFDTPALGELLRRLHAGRVEVVEVTTASPSPFAHSLLFGYVSQFIYGEDAPLAERRAAALTVDSDLISDLLGQGADVAELLDVEALTQVEAEVALATPARRATNADQLTDLIRRLGPVATSQLQRRAAEPGSLVRWLDELTRTGRIFAVTVAGEERWAVVEDAATIRDGLGATLPPGIAGELLSPAPRALEDLVRRYARTHGPFRQQQLADHYDLPVAALSPVLEKLRHDGTMTSGTLRPPEAHTAATARMPGPDFCEVEVLRRIRRRSLQALRGEVEPVAPHRLGTFLAGWQQIRGGRSNDLLDVIDQLAASPIAASAWESLVLPLRVPGYLPQMLDELTSAGEVVWVGAGGGTGTDGLLSLLPADAVADMAPVATPPDDPHVEAVLRHLASGGKFFSELLASLRDEDESTIPDATALADALWKATWAGLVTNDTLAPLRVRLSPRTRRQPHRRRRGYSMRALTWQAGARHSATVPEDMRGRWSLVGRRGADDRRAVVAAAALLDRDGIITRGNANECIPGGFAAGYRILSQLEEGGQVRRGYFIDGLGGAQFAVPAAVERLRDHPSNKGAVLLAATDPANPYGSALDWPPAPVGTAEGTAHRPGRKVGAHVVLVNGQLVLYLERGGKTLLSFMGPGSALTAAAAELTEVAAHGALGRLTLTRIDGAAALGNSGPAATVLLEAGLIAAPGGLRLRRR